jgi:metal-responsive CopG/Arc/MetJ family transcriptional regulator
MKTAVSIPDEVFEKIERRARRAGRSRSEVFSAALAEYVARQTLRSERDDGWRASDT